MRVYIRLMIGVQQEFMYMAERHYHKASPLLILWRVGLEAERLNNWAARYGSEEQQRMALKLKAAIAQLTTVFPDLSPKENENG